MQRARGGAVFSDRLGTQRRGFKRLVTALASIAAIIAPFVVVVPAHGGDITWTAETSGTANVLRGVSCPSVPTCFVVGDAGTILATTNGGSTWMAQASGTSYNLRGVSCPAITTCFAVGDTGTILATTNGGNTWRPQASGSPLSIYDVSCPTAATCFAVGDLGKVFVTTNAGSLWTKQNAGTTVNLRGISCPSTSTCFAVGYSGTILATFNAGSPWTAQTSGTTNTLRSVSCASNTTCFAVGDAGITLATTNGGVAWTRQTSGTSNSLFDVSCVSTSTCFAAGVSGTILDTTTSGSVWTDPTPDTSADLNSVSCPFQTACLAVGGAGTIVTSGSVPSAADPPSGNTWTKQTSGNSSQLYGVSCPSTTTCFAVGFTRTYSGPGYVDSGAILTTGNAGIAWTAQTSGVWGQLRSISCPSTTICFAVGDSGTVLATTSGGSAWTTQTSGTTNGLNGVSCPSSTTCFAVGDSGTVRTTTNGGSAWTAQTSGTTYGLSGVSCPSTTTCYAAGDSGTVRATMNGGSAWTAQTSGTTYDLSDVSCPTTATCFAVGADNNTLDGDVPGTIVGSSNGGSTWTPQRSETNDALSGVSCASAASACFAVGGRVSCTTTPPPPDCSPVSSTIVTGPGPWVGAVSIVADLASVIVGGSSTLTATTSESVTGTGSAIEIFDDGTDEFVASCSTGKSCQATVTQSTAGAHTYIAYVAGPGTSYPPSQIHATSNATTVEWTQGSAVANVDHAGARIRYLGETSYPSVYAGVSVDETALTVSLQVTSLGPETTAMLQAANGVAVAVNIVPRSYTALMSLNQNVTDDEAYWAAQGVTITEFGPDVPTDTLFIGIDPYSAAAAAAIQARYGAQNVTVAQGASSGSLADRKHDSKPWNGGDYVADHPDGSGHVCTTGFGIYKVNPNNPPSKYGTYLVLAGHCFANGIYVYNNGVYVGTAVRNSKYQNNGDDIEYIQTSSSYHIWETNTGTADSDGSIELPPKGATVCHSGIATNKRCGTVSDTNRTIWDVTAGMWFAHQDVVTSSSLLVAGGDSGGPWFDAYTSGIRYFSAVGITKGWYGSKYTCNTQIGTNSSCSNSATYTEAYYGIWVDAGGYWVNHA